MASLVLGAAGAMIGSMFGMPQVGYAIGSALGSYLGQSSGSGTQQTIEGPRMSDTQIMNSAYGVDITRIFNTHRTAGHVIWSTKIKETKHSHTTTQSSGGGGKGGSSGGSGDVKTTTISYTYSQNLAIAVCKGPILSIKRIWANNKLVYDGGSGTLNFTLHLGDETQVADSYIQSIEGAGNVPGYRGMAYIVLQNLELEPFGNATPNLEFEVESAPQNLGQIVSTLLLDAGLQASQFDVSALTDTVLGYKISNRGTTRQYIEPLATAFFFDAVESQSKIKFVKRGSTTVAATILQDDLDARDAGADPGDLLHTTRKMELELTQELVVIYPDKDKAYEQSQQYERKLTTSSRLRKKVEIPIVLQTSSAKTIAVTQLHAEWVARMAYALNVGRKYTRLEPTDIIDVVKNGIHFPMRIITKNESKPGIIAFEAEAEDSGVWTYSAPTSLNVPSIPTFFGNDPGTIRTPIIIDAPETSASATGCELIVAACGQTLDWGGCRVWMSLDDVTFSPVGAIRGPSFMGVTTTTLPLVADEDVTSTLGIDLTNSGGTLSSVSQAVSDTGMSLCYLDGEMITFKNAVLTAVNKYNLTTMHRGVNATPVAAHASGVPFLVVDSKVFRYAYLPEMVGRTIYLKFTSFNTFLLAEQDLADVTSIAYQLKGPLVESINSFALASPWVGKDVKFKWGDIVGADSYTMTVKTGSTTLRVVAGITNRDFTYTFEDNTADNAGAPKRSLTFILTAVGLGLGQMTATLNVSNPQMAVPGGLAVAAGVASFAASFENPTSPDYAGFTLKYSTVSGFNPASAGTVGFDGPGTMATVMGLAQGTQYFIRIKAYDVFESTTATWSSELSVTTLSAGGVPIVTSIPLNPAAIGGVLAFFYDTADEDLRGLWGWDGTAWKNTRDGANLVANSVTADQMNVANLAAISANLGVISTGVLNLDSAGYIRSTGMNFGSGNGLFFGYNAGAYKMQVGNTAGQYLIWDGTNMFINSPQFAIGNGLASFSGTLSVKSAATGARVEIENDVIKVFDSAGTLRVKIGDLAA